MSIFTNPSFDLWCIANIAILIRIFQNVADELFVDDFEIYKKIYSKQWIKV